MLCSANVQYGAAILTYDDPDNAGNTITLIVVIFKRTNSVTCEVKEPTGEKGPGKTPRSLQHSFKRNFRSMKNFCENFKTALSRNFASKNFS